MSRRLLFAMLILNICAAPALAQVADLNDELEKAMKQAVQKVGPSVVQIVTQGGADMVVTTAKGPVFRKALGPTTGVIVGADGWVISSAFNFINNPTTILVAVPGHPEPYVAKRVANDKARMLTLLKIDKTGLPVPALVPSKELQVGQWAVAVGRTLDAKREQPPSVSVGIISALGRIWGRALQTDAKVSPVNYGGPLIDLQGRVQGILVPASPRGEGETSGFEWYDSGIGFAIPMEDIRNLLPRLQQGKDLHKGLLGIRVKSGDTYGTVPEVAEVVKDSAAARAGLKPGDVIVEIDGQPVVRMTQIQHLLGPKYEGDKIALKYRRGQEVVSVADLVLVGWLQAYGHPFLGILPMRDDPKLGVEIRHVFAKSPAERAGLKIGDRLLKIGVGAQSPFTGMKSGRDELSDRLNTLVPGALVKLEVKRQDGKTETVGLTLDALPGTVAGQEDAVPAKLPEQATHKKALAPLETSTPKVKPPKIDPDARKAETGLIERTTGGGQKYWLWVHEGYDANVAQALVIWLHPPGKNKKEDFDKWADLWVEACREHNLILLGPHSDNESGWVPSEADGVLEAVRDTMLRYTIDKQRVVAHGLGVGGQMAFYLGFLARDLVRGVATMGAVATHIKDNAANQRLGFYVAAGTLDPLAKTIAEGKAKLVERRFPVVLREFPNRGREYLEEADIRELARWIDALDRL